MKILFTILISVFSFTKVSATAQYPDKIFYDLGNSISKIQRIGDKNQSIYNSVKSDEIWINRQEVLRLSESQRLSQPIANVHVAQPKILKINFVNIITKFYITI